MHLRAAVYLYPKFIFINVYTNRKLIFKQYVTLYSILFSEFKSVLKALGIGQAWFCFFLFQLFPSKFFRKYLSFHVNYQLFNKSFEKHGSPNFYYLLSKVGKENLVAIVYKMLKARYLERRKRIKKK